MRCRGMAIGYVAERHSQRIFRAANLRSRFPGEAQEESPRMTTAEPSAISRVQESERNWSPASLLRMAQWEQCSIPAVSSSIAVSTN